MRDKIITILTGNEVLERYLIPKLIAAGAYIKIISNSQDRDLQFKVAGTPGQVSIIPAGNYKTEILSKALSNSDVVINLREAEASSCKKQFIKFHIKLPILLGKIAKELKIPTVIQLSTLNANQVYDNNYTYYKYESEKAIQNEMAKTIVVRHCIMFGENDQFLFNLRRAIDTTPILPTTIRNLGSFQPIFAGDVAATLEKIIKSPEQYYSKIIELGGEEIFSIKKVATLIAKQLNKNIKFIKLPYPIFAIVSKFFEIFLSPIVTKEQIQLLQHNNIIKKQNNLIFIDSFHIKQYSLTDFIKNNF
jgi:NADH dehydrogenase